MARYVRLDRLHLRRNRFRSLDHDVVTLYQQALQNGDKFPPIDLIDEFGKLWINAGYHRFYAQKREGPKTILARTMAKYRLEASAPN